MKVTFSVISFSLLSLLCLFVIRSSSHNGPLRLVLSELWMQTFAQDEWDPKLSESLSNEILNSPELEQASRAYKGFQEKKGAAPIVDK